MKPLLLFATLLPAVAGADPDVRGRLMAPVRANLDLGLPLAIRVTVADTPEVCDLPIRVMLSTDDTAGDDLVLANLRVPGCLQDGASRMTYPVFPNEVLGGVQPGDTRQVIVQLDPDGIVSESDETNNELVSAPILFDNRPDLEVRDLGLGVPWGCVFGEPFQASFGVLNTGVLAAESFDVALVLASAEGDVTLGTAHVDTLDLGASTVVEIAGTVPDDGTLAAGPYRVAAAADTSGEIEEIDEANNVLEGEAVVCQPPAADLAVTRIDVPAIAAAGEQLWVHRGIENLGLLGGEASLRYVLTADDSVSEDDVELPVVDARPVALVPGDVDEATDVLLVPASVPAGTYHVAIQVNPQGQLAELSEDNNLLVSALLEMREASLRVVTQTLPRALIGYPYLWQLVAVGGGGVDVWSAESPLPSGLVLEPSGVLKGTPDAEGSYILAVRVRSGAASAGAELALDVVIATGQLFVSTSALPLGHVAESYSATLSAMGGEPPYEWSIAGALPAGIALDGDVLAGFPQATGCTTIGLLVSDVTGTQSLRALPLCVVGDTDVSFVTTEVKDAIVGEPYQQVLQAAGGAPPYTYDVKGLEGSGLSAVSDDAAVVVSGVPVAPGRIEIDVRATDSVGLSARRPYLIVVRSREILLATRPLPVALRGAAYPDTQLEADRPGVVFHLQGGELPEGLKLGEDGFLAGTVDPAAGLGTRSFLVRASDAEGSEGFGAYSIEVRAPPEATTSQQERGCCSGDGAAAQVIPAGLLLLLRPRRARRRP